MNTFNDFSQLKSIKASPKITVTPAPKAESPEDRALRGAKTSCDYFSSLLGGSAKETGTVPVKAPRATVVTPATIDRVRREQAQDALDAERAAARAREAALQEELEAQTAATESIATDLAALKAEYDALKGDNDAIKADCVALKTDCVALKTDCEMLKEELNRAADEVKRMTSEKESLRQSQNEMLKEKDAEIERLKELLDDAKSDVRLRDSLIDKPELFSEKFKGEVREHVIEVLSAANVAAESGGRDRRARILEAVLGANPSSGELESRREAVKKIIKDSGQHLDDDSIKQLEKLGFRYVSGKNHHKIEWAGIRFPIAKTPSDFRACLNSAAEINNRVF